MSSTSLPRSASAPRSLENTWEWSFGISDGAGQETRIPTGSGKLILIAGPNGVGKSALLYSFYRQALLHGGRTIELLPGHRQIHFSTDNFENVEQTHVQLANNMSVNHDAFSRYRNTFGETHLQGNVKRIANVESEINAAIVEVARITPDVRRFAADRPSLIGRINNIFGLAKMPVRLHLANGIVRATRNGSDYSIDRMSDGERAALLLVGTILVQPEGSILIVDEPEKHLHQSISGPLVASAARARGDIGLVFSTHDLSLIDWLTPESIVHLRDSAVVSFPPEHMTYEFVVLDSASGLTDELKIAILGARKAILFVEGAATSSDRALYSIIYKGWNVIPKGGWEQVTSSVRALRENKELTWLSVYGIIDGDGRTEQERMKLESDGIFSVSGHTVENLFLLPEVIKAMAVTAFDFDGGDHPEQRIKSVKEMMKDLVLGFKEEIVARRATWSVNRSISEMKVSAKSLVGGQRSLPAFDFTSVVDAEVAKLKVLIASVGELDLPSKVPIKNTGIPSQIVKALGYISFDAYKKAVLKRLDRNDFTARRMVVAMRRRLAKLPR